MRAHLASKFGGVVWRKILGDHPNLIELFARGNEETLATARREHAKLDDAILRFGPPPPELIAELLGDSRGGGGSQPPAGGFSGLLRGLWGGNSPEGAAVGRFDFNESFSLPESDLQSFYSDGFVVVPGAVPPEVVNQALRHINNCIGRGAVNRNIPTLVGLEPASAGAAALMDLYNTARGSKLPTTVQSLLGRGRAAPPLGCQVALKFPAAAATVPTDGGAAEAAQGRRWHVDGFGEGRHSPFTVLVGVCLSDVPAPCSGELAVHPGAHWGLVAAVREQVARGSAAFSGLDGAVGGRVGRPDLGRPAPVLLRKGDAVVCHQKLPHLGSSNYSPDVRYQVYFRISHVDLATHRDRWLDDLMLPFEGVRAALPGAVAAAAAANAAGAAAASVGPLLGRQAGTAAAQATGTALVEPTHRGYGATALPAAGALERLVAMGFDRPAALAALAARGGNEELALDSLLGE